jgi:hypothetical protein
VFTKVIKMPSQKAWVERPVGLIKEWVEFKRVKYFLQGCQMEAENVSRE